MKDLFKRGDQFVYRYSGKTESDVLMAHFLSPENKFVSGVLYSNIHLWQCNAECLDDNVIFIQNPYAKI
jgi:hypothetical protein